MSYSYTEKKRIRKNFGTFAKVMDLPNLVETQTKSYSEFLQADLAPDSRKNQGLEDVFNSLFPIKSVSGNAALEYVSYELGKPAYDVKPGTVYGSTDDYGYYAEDKPVHFHDLHATILHLMGIDHEEFTYRYAGRDFRLTDVEGKVVHEILS